MGMFNAFGSSDADFYSTHHFKIVINDLDNRTNEDRKSINKLLMLEVGETFDNVPSCQCGALNMKMYKGVRCTQCDTIVEEVVGTELDNKMWVRTPEGLPALMNVQFWHLLQSYLERNRYNFSVLQWLTDPTYKPTITKMSKSIQMLLRRLDEVGLNVRSYRHFYENFDTYIRFLLTDKAFKKSTDKKGSKNFMPKPQGEELLELFLEHKDIVWQQYIQIPNKALTIVENNNGKKWVDQSTPKLLRAIRLMVGIDNKDNSRSGMSIRTKESRTSKFLSYLGMYYNLEINPKFLGQKPGLIRKHIIGTRSNFTGRFVITAINGPHSLDEVHLPWIGFMGMFDPIIRSMLYNKHKLSVNKISQIMTKYQKTYHPELHKLFLEILENGRTYDGRKGWTLLSNRNPTLKHGSITADWLPPKVGVKIDVNDMSASVSGASIPFKNGDFDGDQLTFWLPVDQRMTKACGVFAHTYSVGDLINPYVADGVTSIPKQTVMQLNIAGLNHDLQIPTLEQVAFMKQFAV